MFTKFANLKTMLLFLCLSLVVVACGDDDSSTSPTPTPKINLELDDYIEGIAMGFSIPYSIESDQVIQAYLGDFHRDNYLTTLNKLNDSERFSINLDGEISTQDRFDAYKNLDYNKLECTPENLGRSKSYVRFFVVENDKKVKELVLATKLNENNPDFDRLYQIYFWTETGTAKGIETPYNVNYNVVKGWNITEKTGNNLIRITEIQGETRFFEKP